MAKLKTYDVADTAGYLHVHFSNREINRATGEPAHIRQFNLCVTAKTKADALAALRAIGKPNATERNLRVSSSSQVERLREAGYLTEGSVLVTGTMARSSDPIASLRPGPSAHEPIVEALPSLADAAAGPAK